MLRFVRMDTFRSQNRWLIVLIGGVILSTVILFAAKKCYTSYLFWQYPLEVQNLKGFSCYQGPIPSLEEVEEKLERHYQKVKEMDALRRLSNAVTHAVTSSVSATNKTVMVDFAPQLPSKSGQILEPNK